LGKKRGKREVVDLENYYIRNLIYLRTRVIFSRRIYVSRDGNSGGSLFPASVSFYHISLSRFSHKYSNNFISVKFHQCQSHTIIKKKY